jgi:hypothetical protein
MGLGDYAQARANFDAALQIMQRADLQWHIPPTRLGLACVRGNLGDYGGAVQELRATIESVDRLKLPRYQLMAYEMLASLLLDVGLNRQALEAMQRWRALGESTGITFWRVRGQATHAIARVRLGDLDLGPALSATLNEARERLERSQMVRCLEGLAELALRRGEPAACMSMAGEMLALADGADMKELAARGHYWRGEALAALGERDAALEHLSSAAAGAEAIGRVRLARDATAALARVGGDAAHAARAAALAARIDESSRECSRAVGSA